MFQTTNYLIDTRSDVEWYFVVDPDKGREQFGKEAFASEGRWWPASRLVNAERTPITDKDKVEFDAKRRDVNAQLAVNNCMPLLDMEIFGARLYTGPVRSPRHNLRPDPDPGHQP